jgi:hypothetical protein
MTVLAKIQHFCIIVERITEISASVGLLPGQLGSFPQLAFFGHAKLEVRCGVEYQLWGV